MAALDAHIARSAPARAPPRDETVQGASEEPRGDGGSDPEVEGAASSARDGNDAGDAGGSYAEEDEELDVTAGADDESIAGTDDGDDAGSSPARSTPAPAPLPPLSLAPVALPPPPPGLPPPPPPAESTLAPSPAFVLSSLLNSRS